MPTQLPTRLQSTLSTLLLLTLSLLLSPLSFAISLFFSLTHTSSSRHAPVSSPRRTVLINGARMQKSLAVSRTFSRAGWRVILVEERGWGLLASTRFSNSVSSIHLVPSSSLPAPKGSKITPYIAALVEIALREKVDLFFPCSGAGSTGQDALAGQILMEKTGGSLRSMIQTPELVETLHEKDKFISLLQELDMAAPRSEIVYSVDEALEKLKGGFPRCILKCAAELDDVGRADMTLYPLLSPSHQPDWERTRKRLSSLSIPLCNRTPYILQEFIGDREGKKATEWCTHATVVDGKLTAFVCCPSNDMLMTYYPASHTIVGELALRWTSTFLYRLQKLGLESGREWNRETLVGRHAPPEAGVTGQFSMDFIYQPSTAAKGERLVAIECNPRVHTAICLLVGNPELGPALIPKTLGQNSISEVNGGLGETDELSYLSSLSLPVMEAPPEAQSATQTDLAALKDLPPTFASSRIRFYHAKSQRAYHSEATPLPQSWIGHDLPARIIPQLNLLGGSWVQWVMSFVHPLWPRDVVATPGATRVRIEEGKAEFDLGAGAPLPPFTDPAFAKDDPWPFFALYHLQWPQLLIWQLVVRRNKWSRINVSTARIFEC